MDKDPVAIFHYRAFDSRLREIMSHYRQRGRNPVNGRLIPVNWKYPTIILLACLKRQ